MDANRVTVVEVGPRDGLQNEAEPVTAETKLDLVRRLAQAGLPVIEAAAFVSPKWVPQMADAEAVMAGLGEFRDLFPDTRFPVLVPNEKGLERALTAGADEIALFTAASETFNRKNTNSGIEQSLERFAPLADRAKKQGLRVRGYVSCVLGCPYEGAIEPAAVTRVALGLAALGCDEVSLGDTIGVGTPRAAVTMLEAVAAEVAIERLAVHFHDTYGQALANIHACLEAGVRVVDASVGGLGGCPYAPGASGNVATEDVVYLLHGLGFATGIDLEALALTGAWISERLDRPDNSRAGRAIAGRLSPSSSH